MAGGEGATSTVDECGSSPYSQVSAPTKMTGAFQGPQWPTPTYGLSEEPYRQMLWKQPSLGVLQMHEDPVERFK